MSESSSSPDTQELLGIYETAHTIRLVDQTLRNLLDQAKFRGVLYPVRGQEVVAACIGSTLRSDDQVVTTYRGMHDQIAKGVPLDELLAELYGKATGCCKGKGGPMHITDADAGVMVTTGIVGAGLPIATGLALAAKMQGSDRVCVVNFGDGATNIGAFHEAMNLAAVWDLPVIFVCQNNEYAEYTHRLETQRGEIFERAAAYGMPGVVASDDDPRGMVRASEAAVARARAGEGPTLLECRTFRYMGHIYGEPQAYMDKEELARRMANDPVDALRNTLVSEGVGDAVNEREKSVRAAVDAAVTYAIDSPLPEERELMTDIYAGPVVTS
ncbi:thiamine pyrophosphate-dependent dehydrogenase E1 component subunit alpha [Mycobacterium vicinigordonae]|uniref:Thiamine pyrophosphate-dependent dehydrogenase E1 component subunit alpha n=1 Tax=Mycobacterium vicinigordonae TaxID=1719132 RepID=A0A7D6E3C7_9MYCO|nr:thiamine pyrophosphate-dependent dehydrogenase E1 component subunit alpha [Mycobacterium vicinigordonae]QLL08721.1 thiamine pyrophosphate-dependent dehydrogenase E1 component subunit alpha [Mycobacterium vicinigordonae]